jgi:hypothetical protein
MAPGWLHPWIWLYQWHGGTRKDVIWPPPRCKDWSSIATLPRKKTQPSLRPSPNINQDVEVMRKLCDRTRWRNHAMTWTRRLTFRTSECKRHRESCPCPLRRHHHYFQWVSCIQGDMNTGNGMKPLEKSEISQTCDWLWVQIETVIGGKTYRDSAWKIM